MKKAFFCQECGTKSLKWLGRCPGCGAWNSMVEESVEPAGVSSPTARRQRRTRVRPQPITEIEPLDRLRVPTGIGEFDRILGGGVVSGSLVLVGGEPGIGKSTILLQVSSALAASGETVLYVSGEESIQQTRLRAGRLGAKSERLLLVAETDLDQVLEDVAEFQPSLVIVDSIQTMFLPALSSAPGSIAQVRECGGRLLAAAKDGGPSVFLVGHVTKSGSLAGPRVLEHLVDTVLYFEGDRHHAYRILRAVKNRFGSTDEIGIFEMGEGGLREVLNPSEIFLSQRGRDIPGSAVVPCLEGQRPLLVEVQALVTHTSLAIPRRRATGIDLNRVLMLLAVLQGRCGVRLEERDVFVNVAGGVRVGEPAADLGVIAALFSTVRDRPLDPALVVIGEVGLGGEVRPVRQLSRRLKEAGKLGFRRAVVPAAGLKAVTDRGELELSPVSTVKQALGVLFNE